ncbi:MAG: folate-binding protein YgfZ [Thiothrix sp.]|nr:folate-binding protein YgfZ [Thiothrix sp.]
MKPEWKQFLTNRGAEFEAGHLLHFGNPERERRIPPQGAILCDLSHTGLISVNGADSRDFLQGQLSNDINRVSPQQAQLSAYSTPKGRTITEFQIMERQGTLYLSLARDNLEAVLKRLRLYVLRAKVTLEDATESLVHFGYADPRGDQRLAAAIGTIPEQVLEVVQHGDLTLIRRPAPVPRFEVFGELDAACDLWEKLGVHAAGVGAGGWNHFEIEAGIPHLDAASTEAWVPQMLNLHRIDGISFTKGCFPGQEIVARLQYLGDNKRLTYRLGIEGFELPPVGAVISAPDGSEAGRILNSARNPDGGVETLAVLKIAAARAGLQLDGRKVAILPLPYALEQPA